MTPKFSVNIRQSNIHNLQFQFGAARSLLFGVESQRSRIDKSRTRESERERGGGDREREKWRERGI